MALPLTGTITSAMILAEMGYTGSHTIKNIVLRASGVLQVSIDDTWVSLNMCSPYLPTEISPYIVPTHWYGYNHSTTGVETITISGDSTIDVGQTVTYTATLTGNNLTGIVLTWYKFENNSWSLALNTGTSTTITWVDPRGAQVKVVASNTCKGDTVAAIKNITYNCNQVTPSPVWMPSTLYVGETYDVYAEKAVAGGGTVILSPSNLPLGATLLWEVTGNVSIIGSNTHHKCTIRPDGAGSLLNVRVTVLSCGYANSSGWTDFTGVNHVTYYYNTLQTRSIQRNNCSVGVGNYYTVQREAGTHSSTVSVADANSMAIAWLYGQEAQDIANANASCGDVVTWPNEQMSQFFTKYCTSGVGTLVEYIVSAGKYYSTSVAAANTLAQNDIDANGQNYANDNGQCNATCLQVVNSVSISTSASTFSNGTYSGTYTVNVAVAGNYYVTICPEGYKAPVTIVYLNAGTNIVSYSKSYVSAFTERIKINVTSSCNFMEAFSGVVTATVSTPCNPPTDFVATKFSESSNGLVVIRFTWSGTGKTVVCNNSVFTCSSDGIVGSMYSPAEITIVLQPGNTTYLTFRIYDSTNSCYTDVTKSFTNTYVDPNVNTTKLSFLAFNPQVTSSYTTWQVDNFAGSNTNIQYRYKVDSGSDLWSGWITLNQGSGTIGLFQKNGASALIPTGTIIVIEITLLAINLTYVERISVT